MNTPPMSGCFCDDCIVDYFKQGYIHRETPAWNDTMNILNSRNLTFTQISDNHTPNVFERPKGIESTESLSL